MEIKINYPEQHNPRCFITEFKVSTDIMITCVIEMATGRTMMEYYKGRNYVSGSRTASHSRVYFEHEIPKVYLKFYTELKEKTLKYYEFYKLGACNESMDIVELLINED